jgi:hypothetical protein
MACSNNYPRRYRRFFRQHRTPRHSLAAPDLEEQQQPNDYHWEPLADDLPASPAFREESLGKIYCLAVKLKR